MTVINRILDVKFIYSNFYIEDHEQKIILLHWFKGVNENSSNDEIEKMMMNIAHL